MSLRTAAVVLVTALALLAAGCRSRESQEQPAASATVRSPQAARDFSSAQMRARRRPQDAAAQMAAARLGVQAGAYNDAYRAYRRAVELDPSNYEALVGLAQVNLRLQNPTEGLDWLLRAKRLKPQDVELTELEARLLLMNGNFDRSIEGFRRALRMDPQRTSTWLNLASAYALMNKPTEAVGAAREAVRVDPDSAATHFALARHLQRAGDGTGAEEQYREALRLDPQNAAAQIALARLLMEQSRKLDEARQLAIRASQIRTDRADAAIIAAWILHLQGEDQKAANELIKLVNASPQNPEAWEKLAVTLHRIGKEKEAREAEAMARRFVPGKTSAADVQMIQGTP